eukprot:COSAG05_NODE_26_length_29797_cov_35.911139_9_plen_56_part_00
MSYVHPLYYSIRALHARWGPPHGRKQIIAALFAAFDRKRFAGLCDGHSGALSRAP